MFKSYFFVPADKKKYIDKIRFINCSCLILDMEESVDSNNINICIQNLYHLKIEENYSIRFPINYKDITSNKDSLLILYSLGFRRFMLPKIQTVEDMKNTIEFFLSHRLLDVKYDIFIESPLALLNTIPIIEHGIGTVNTILIGSHDFCNIVGCKHTMENLLYFRQKLLIIGKAYRIPVVDVVSTNIYNEELFKKECIESFNMGFDGKSLIHPKQLNAFKNTLYYSKSEVIEANAVYCELNKMNKNSFSIMNINGTVYEKPHLKRIFEIIEWNKHGGYYDL